MAAPGRPSRERGWFSLRISLRQLMACVALALSVGAAAFVGSARAATQCVYPAAPGVTLAGTTATVAFAVIAGCGNVQVSAVSIVHAADPANDAILASATGS